MTTIGHARQAVGDAKARAELYRMWQTGYRAGLSHANVLETMGERTDSPDTEAWRRKIIAGTTARRTLASIAKANSSLVQPFEAALLVAGEESGSLEQALRSLGDHFQGEHRLLLKVWSKLTYPLMVSLVAVLILPLPLVVQGMVKQYWVLVAIGLALWYGLGGSLVAVIATRYASRREFVLGRLARALANGIEAGLSLDRVVTLAADISGDSQIVTHVRKIPPRERGARPISEIFEGCDAIPPEMISAMRVGELSGDYSGSLRKMAELYDPV